MRHERRLDLERADAVAGRDDHVVGAALEPEVAVLVLTHAVAGAPGARLRPVDEERRDRLRVRAQLAVLDPEPEPRQRPAHRAGLDWRADRHAGERAGLGLAVAVVYRDANALLPQPDDLRVERLAGRHGMAERGEGAQLGALGDGAPFGRRHAQHVHSLPLDDREALLRVEARVVQECRGAAQPWCNEHVPGRLRPTARGGAPGEVAWPGAEPVLGLHALARQVALAVTDRLRLAGRARGERDDRGSLG